MIELTERQQKEVAVSKRPVRLLDRASNREYVLVRADLFERMQKALAAEAVDPSFYEFEEIDRPTS